MSDGDLSHLSVRELLVKVVTEQSHVRQELSAHRVDQAEKHVGYERRLSSLERWRAWAVGIGTAVATLFGGYKIHGGKP